MNKNIVYSQNGIGNNAALVSDISVIPPFLIPRIYAAAALSQWVSCLIKPVAQSLSESCVLSGPWHARRKYRRQACPSCPKTFVWVMNVFGYFRYEARAKVTSMMHAGSLHPDESFGQHGRNKQTRQPIPFTPLSYFARRRNLTRRSR